jgi:hypothetical protein
MFPKLNMPCPVKGVSQSPREDYADRSSIKSAMIEKGMRKCR